MVIISRYLQHNGYEYGYETVDKRRVFGYPFRIMKMLAQYMNFSYRVISPREDDWGKNINGTWTGVLGMLQTREADLAADMLTIHYDRTACFDYILPPIGESKRMILYKKEDVDEDHLTVFLGAFQPGVFIMLGVSLIIYIAFLSCVRLIHKKGDLNKNSNNNKLNGNAQSKNRPSQNIMPTVFEAYGATLKQGSTISSSHDSERILITGWWIFTTIISAVYCGTIMATCAVELAKPPFSNMAELVSRKDYTIGYDSSSITENIIQNSNLSYLVAFKQNIRRLSIKDPGLLSNNITKHLQKIQEGKYAFIASMVMLPLAYAKCQLEMIDARLSSSYTAFHLPKSSPFKDDLQEHMYRLSDSGFMHRAFKEWIHLRVASEETCQAKEFPKAVSLIRIQSIFIAAGIGLGCSTLILIAEVVWHMTRHAMRQR